MEELFLKLVNMSLTASWMVLAVILARFLLKNAPKYIRVILWGFVGLRLIFPFSPESIFSLIPSSEPLPEEFLYAAAPQVNTGIPVINNAINPIIAQSFTPAPAASANPTQILSFIYSQVWILGMVLMVAYAAVSYLLVRHKVSASIRIGKNLRICDHLDSPFILGIFRPVIYLPSELDQKTADMVLAHEFAHLKRKDHWWKPLGFALLSIYWFNPIMWLAYILLCRDIELACDEKVIKDLGAEEKKAYSSALLSCSVPRRLIAVCPLAFGEVDVKDRIKSVLNYKKPAFWIIVVAVILCIVVAVCFLTDPAGTPFSEITPGAHRDVLSVTVINGSRSYEITTAEGIRYVEEFLEELTVDKREVSKSRSQDRDKTNTIILHLENIDRSYHFSALCSEVWFDDTVKPTMTYSVKNQEDVMAFFESTIEAPVVHRLDIGTYTPAECLYMNPLSSYYPGNVAEEFRFQVTQDGFTTSDLRTGETTAVTVDWQWRSVIDAQEDMEFFLNWIKDGDTYSLGGDILYQKIDSSTHIVRSENGELLLINGGNGRKGLETVWAIYRLERAAQTSDGLAVQQDGYSMTILDSEHHSNAVALTVRVTFPEEIAVGTVSPMPEDVTLGYTAKNGETTAILNHNHMHDPEDDNSIIYDFVFNLENIAPTANIFTLTIPDFESRMNDSFESGLSAPLTLSWQADVDQAHSYEYNDGNSKITLSISPNVINVTAYKTSYNSMTDLIEDLNIVDLFGNRISYQGSWGGHEGGRDGSTLINMDLTPAERIDIDLIRSISIGEYTLRSTNLKEHGIVTQYPDGVTEVWKNGRSKSSFLLINPEANMTYRSMEPLDAAIYSAIREANFPEDGSDTLWMESHTILSELVTYGQTADGKLLGHTEVAVLAMYCRVEEHNGEVKLLDVHQFPVAISFDESEDHTFTVTEYRQAEKQEDIESFIRTEFPAHLLPQMRPLDKIFSELTSMINWQSESYFNLGPRPTISELLQPLKQKQNVRLSLYLNNEETRASTPFGSYNIWDSPDADEFLKYLQGYTFEEIDYTKAESTSIEILLFVDEDQDIDLHFYEGSRDLELYYNDRITFFRASRTDGDTTPIGTVMQNWYASAEAAAIAASEEGITPSVEFVLESLQKQNATQIALNSGGDQIFGEYGAWGVLNDVQNARALQNYTYETIDESKADSSGLSVCLKFGHSSQICYLYFYENSNFVKMYYNGYTRYFEAVSKYGDSFTVGQIARNWYDQAEYEAMQASTFVVENTGQDYLTAAQEFCEAYEGVKLSVREDSMYRYSFLSCQVEEAVPAANQGRVDGTLDENGYAFWLTVTFVPANERSSQQAMAGNTYEYSGSDPNIPDGSWVYTRCGYIRLTEDGWVGEIVGTCW